MKTINKETNEITKDYYDELISFLKASHEAIENCSADFQHAETLLRKTEQHYANSIRELEKISEKRFDDTSLGSKIYEGFAKATASVTSLFSGIGEHDDSKTIRDNYSALTAASCGFQMLYTTDVSGYGETAYSERILQLIRTHHQLIMEYAEVIPKTVAHELAEEDDATFNIDHTDSILEKLRSTWR